MSLKKLGVALLAVFALGAIMANSAFAENEFKSPPEGQWYTETSSGVFKHLAVGETDDITVKGGASFLTTTFAGSAIRFDSTSVEGTECSAVNNTTTTATIDCKNLTYKGVTVSGPGATGCTSPTTITTKELTGLLGMNTAGTVATLQITPKAGAGTAFAVIELTGTCAAAGPNKVTGTVFAKAINATGFFAKTQSLESSEALQKAAGTATSLKFGENGAFINGSLEGTATLPWAGKEK